MRNCLCLPSRSWSSFISPKGWKAELSYAPTMMNKQGIICHGTWRQPTQKHPKWWNRTSGCESDGRFWIGKPGFLATIGLPRLVFGDIRVWQTDGRTAQTTTTAGPHILTLSCFSLSFFMLWSFHRPLTYTSNSLPSIRTLTPLLSSSETSCFSSLSTLQTKRT